MSDSTHFQTELSDEKYRHFKSLARERGLSLTAALREATEVWMAKQERVDPDDPLFEILDELDREPRPEKPRTNAAQADDPIEEWSGSAAEPEFSDASASED